MADIRAFRGYRYDLAAAGPLTDLVCPPYDVIDADLQRELYAKSEFNAVRVEFTAAAGDKYADAGQTLRDWLAAGTVRQDSARSLYVYEQEFTVEGGTFTRRGFLARVRLEPFGTGRIFPHEQTLAGPKADRLALYKATGFNLSPIFGLYSDADDGAFAPLAAAVKNAPPLTATDHLGVVHRLWPVTDQHVIAEAMGAMGPKPVFIADGHHRYETGLKYLADKQSTGDVPDDEHPANFCLMMLVGMTDPGLLILPTHRLVSGLPAVTSPQLKAALAIHFEIVAEYATAAEAWDDVQADGAQTIFGFGTVADGRWLVARLTTPEVMDELAPEQSADWRGLGVSVLHRLVLGQIVRETFGGDPACGYVHLLKEVTDAVAAKACQLACLVPPATMNHVERIAGNRETMPPKSTYFYPKLLTGLVYHSLKNE